MEIVYKICVSTHSFLNEYTSCNRIEGKQALIVSYRMEQKNNIEKKKFSLHFLQK